MITVSKRKRSTHKHGRLPTELLSQTLEGEVWLPLTRSNKYFISNHGRIWSIKTHRFNNGSKRKRKANGRGAKTTVVIENKHYSVHKLVMETFKPFHRFLPTGISRQNWRDTPRPVKKLVLETVIINHIDHNPYNNHVDNLEYTTQKDNANKAIEFYKNNPDKKYRRKKC